MYCPSCSTLAVEGAKFCKVCGLNLNAISQALNGGVMLADPTRDREYKRSRRQVSEGINGAAIGAALLLAAVMVYIIVKEIYFVYPVTLLLALFGLVKLFRSIGSILDAKVGNKFLDNHLQGYTPSGGLPAPGITGNLNSPTETRNSGEYRRPLPLTSRAPVTGTLGSTAGHSSPLSSLLQTPEAAANRPSTGRVNREQSSPLKKLEIDDDLLSKLRN